MTKNLAKLLEFPGQLKAVPHLTLDYSQLNIAIFVRLFSYIHEQICLFQKRVSQVVSFLGFDSDPYMMVIDGKLKWIIDAYTLSDRFAYSQRVSPGFGQKI